MKKIISCLLTVLMVCSLFSACSGGTSETDTENSNEKISIVCTIFPQYDWAKQILGDLADDVELTLLLDSGVDLHNYQPTSEDIVKVSKCDLFIYVGGESDEWVDDTLAQATNENMVTINLLDTLGSDAKEEETVEGMEIEEEEEEDADGEAEYDEHVWLSLKNAEILCSEIADKIAEIDSDNAEAYSENASQYISSLSELEAEYQNVVDNAATTTLLFADRFPFRYLADDYGLSYYAAFSGCSAETEASFETIKFLAEKVDELDLKYVMTLEDSDCDIANTVISSTENQNQEILSMNSMQSITATDIENSANYLDIMEENFETLKTALS
ncbi:MAG: metal ABC transporter substrate-binding protein [Clostridiales bacterium]|nr:metal ABC transporter substrate-binding protein [Clostridiales bacterium]